MQWGFQEQSSMALIQPENEQPPTQTGQWLLHHSEHFLQIPKHRDPHPHVNREKLLEL